MTSASLQIFLTGHRYVVSFHNLSTCNRMTQLKNRPGNYIICYLNQFFQSLKHVYFEAIIKYHLYQDIKIKMVWLCCTLRQYQLCQLFFKNECINRRIEIWPTKWEFGIIFEMRLLNLRINFYLLRTFCPHLGRVFLCCFFFHYVSAN